MINVISTRYMKYRTLSNGLFIQHPTDYNASILIPVKCTK